MSQVLKALMALPDISRTHIALVLLQRDEDKAAALTLCSAKRIQLMKTRPPWYQKEEEAKPAKRSDRESRIDTLSPIHLQTATLIKSCDIVHHLNLLYILQCVYIIVSFFYMHGIFYKKREMFCVQQQIMCIYIYIYYVCVCGFCSLTDVESQTRGIF